MSTPTLPLLNLYETLEAYHLLKDLPNALAEITDYGFTPSMWFSTLHAIDAMTAAGMVLPCVSRSEDGTLEHSARFSLKIPRGTGLADLDLDFKFCIGEDWQVEITSMEMTLDGEYHEFEDVEWSLIGDTRFLFQEMTLHLVSQLFAVEDQFSMNFLLSTTGQELGNDMDISIGQTPYRSLSAGPFSLNIEGTEHVDLLTLLVSLVGTRIPSQRAWSVFINPDTREVELEPVS